MTEPSRIERPASELLDAARKLQSEVEQPGSHLAAADALVALEEALRVVSAAWYQLAADAVPKVVGPRPHEAADQAPARSNGLSPETRVQLVGTLHDVGAAFARCARACREARSVATPIIARATAETRAGPEESDHWFAPRRHPAARA